MGDPKDVLHCRPINLHGNLCGADAQTDGGVTVLKVVTCPACLVMADTPGVVEVTPNGLVRLGPEFRREEAVRG